MLYFHPPPPHPLVVCSTGRSKAVVPTYVSLTLCCFVVYSTRRFVVCLSVCHFVLLFFSPFSIEITSLGEERANLSAFRKFVRFVLVWICRFPLPLGVWEGLRFVIVALPVLFSYLFWLQQDNARVHTCKVAMDAVERNGYELIPHPAYSHDLAPSDFFLFPNLKKGISVDFISGLMKKS